jgi:hypothetical protein
VAARRARGAAGSDAASVYRYTPSKRSAQKILDSLQPLQVSGQHELSARN